MSHPKIYPDVFHVGYQRTGTTWFQKGILPKLEEQIFLAPTRQYPIYFAQTKHDVREIYNELNTENLKGKIVLESEEALSGGRFTDYTHLAERISWINPCAKIWICIRSQFTMIPSLYYLYVRKGGDLSLNSYALLLLENGKLDYSRFVNSYAAFFPKENIKVTLFEEMLDNPYSYFEDVFNWMGVHTPKDLPDQRFQNNSTPAWYIECQRILNSLTGISKIPIRTSAMKNEQQIKLFQKRRMLSKPLHFLLNSAISTGWFNAAPQLDTKLAQTIREYYAPGNRVLFADIQKPIEKFDYPS